MKWFLTRLLAGVAAVAVVLAGVGALLAAQYSGTPAPWAVSQGADAVWVDSADDAGDLRALLDTGAVDTVYLLAGEIGADGGVTAAEDLRPLVEGYPDVRALAWLRHVTEGSSLLSDRFDRQARERLAPAAAEAAQGYAGVHLEIRPVTVNDPSLPTLMEMVREELGGDPVLSVQAHHVEPAPGGRIPSFVVNREEKYWSKGYLARVAGPADEVVLPGTDPGMPADVLDGGFTVRQVTEAVSALRTREEVTVRFGVPSGEQAETVLAAVRIGVTDAEAPEGMRLGVSLSDPADLRLYTAGWLG
ncbi:hypothetical protein SUDANB121_01720 [Nocardiopsis dassonvillei]|uniref:hypothetical protein n=1 Tax=Nocardiopsis dassonvillei TaxID=2014 RepID=UPI003F575810